MNRNELPGRISALLASSDLNPDRAGFLRATIARLQGNPVAPGDALHEATADALVAAVDRRVAHGIPLAGGANVVGSADAVLASVLAQLQSAGLAS